MALLSLEVYIFQSAHGKCYCICHTARPGHCGNFNREDLDHQDSFQWPNELIVSLQSCSIGRNNGWGLGLDSHVFTCREAVGFFGMSKLPVLY